MVKNALSACKKTASPGLSKVGYKLINTLFEHDELFVTSLIQDIINNKCDNSLFSEMEIIPIYKSAKAGCPTQCSS